MQGFFDTGHGSQAMTIASSLLSNIPNVGIFDAVLVDIRNRTTDDRNLSHLSAVARALGLAQREKNRIVGAASKANTPFLNETVDAFYVDPKSIDHDPKRQLKVAAWELDSASQYLKDTWKRHENPISPGYKPLTCIVLENAQTETDNFNDLDFSQSDLSFSILSNAHFKRVKFAKVNLTGAYVRNVILTDADFHGVTSFDGSRWEDSNCWDAKCIPPKMFEYLLRVSPHKLTSEAAASLSSCS
jgi:Pentapeptide repeats (8 copies)